MRLHPGGTDLDRGSAVHFPGRGEEGLESVLGDGCPLSACQPMLLNTISPGVSTVEWGRTYTSHSPSGDDAGPLGWGDDTVGERGQRRRVAPCLRDDIRHL